MGSSREGMMRVGSVIVWSVAVQVVRVAHSDVTAVIETESGVEE